MQVKYTLMEHAFDFTTPSYATKGSAGVDLAAAIIEDIILSPMAYKLIPTGICIELPDSFEAQIRPRSGLAAKHGVTVLNTPGTIDTDYRGEIKVILINLGVDDFVIKRGMRIAQMIVSKFEQASFTKIGLLKQSERGSSGFGSTGY